MTESSNSKIRKHGIIHLHSGMKYKNEFMDPIPIYDI